ncbi:MAG: nucleoside kinase [Bacteroidales bacterium]|nr:nucleoside kinase [Bacteroidales bacterium]
MNNEMKIYCANLKEYIKFQGGERLCDIYERLKERIGITPICARVNNKTENMSYPVFSPKQVEFIDASTPSGRRVYVHSLCMMLYKAVNDTFPGIKLRIEHSISNGYYALFIQNGEILVPAPAMVTTIRHKMRELVEADMPFVRHEKLTSDVVKIFKKQGLDDKVNLLKYSQDLYTVYYTLGGLADSFYGNLAPSTGYLKVFDLQAFKKGMLLMGISKDDITITDKPVRQEKMYKAFTDYIDFNRIIGIKNVGELNEVVKNGGTGMLMNVAEALHAKSFGLIAEEITRRYRKGGARIVLIAGPSSSGKTTSSKRLAIQLMCNLIMPQIISLDDYFVNRTETPRDENGDYDYESLYALDLELFNTHLEALIAGEEVEMPTYNFTTGMREYRGKKLKLGNNSILLIEGIHGLNPELTADIPEDKKFRVYASALTTLSIDDHNWVPTTDNRLLRRMVRDHKYRGVSAVDTIARWQSVRAGEEKWIFPYQENADATFNSSLLFELGVMKEYAEPLLKQVPHNVPEYAEAWRLRMLLSYFLPISEKDIPSTSLLREFLGGSSFRY